MNNPIFAEGAGYVRGRFVPIAEATLPVTDWGFTRSDGGYDVVPRSRRGLPVAGSRRSCIAAWH